MKPRPLEDLRSRAIEDLRRVKGSAVGGGGFEVWA